LPGRKINPDVVVQRRARSALHDRGAHSDNHEPNLPSLERTEEGSERMYVSFIIQRSKGDAARLRA
jgi:hypothetical protein